MDCEPLVRAARRGDDDAFYRLIQEHKAKLYKIAYAYFHNEADALEAIQEVTCRAYTRIGKLREPQFFNTWLTRIMINYCADERRKRNRWTARITDLDLEHADVPAEDAQSASLSKMMVQTALARMEDKYQTIIQLKYFHDLTIAEIAKTMKRPEGTIKTWLHQALKGLRKHLEKEDESRA